MAAGTGFLRRDDAQIAFDWETPEAPLKASRLVVLVNGFQRPRLDYRAFRKRLRDAVPTLAIVSLDNRGVGESVGGITLLSVEVMAADVLAVAQHVCNEFLAGAPLPVAVMGISMGGMIALSAGAADAGMVDRLVLVSTTAGGALRTWADGSKGTRVIPEYQADAVDLAAKKQSLERYFGRDFLQKSPLFVEIMAKNMLKIREHMAAAHPGADPDSGARAQYEAGAVFDALPLLPGITQKVLVITGDDDRVILPANAVDLKQSLPGAELQVYEGKGHLLLVEAPERLTADVVRFLS